MKKIISVLFVVLTLASLISISAFAGDWVFTESQDKVVITDNGDSAYYKGEQYIKTDLGDEVLYDCLNSEYIDHTFYDEKLEKRYEYFDAYMPKNCDYLIITSYTMNDEYFEDYYVKSSHLASVKAYLNGEIGGYKVNHMNGVEPTSLTKAFVESRLIEQYRKTMDGSEVSELSEDVSAFCTTDAGGYVYQEKGLILRKQNDSAIGSEFYVILYSEHSRDSFYAGGTFALGEAGVTTHLYYLGSGEEFPELADLSVNWDAMPEDDLDWVVHEMPPVLSIFLIFTLCGLIPLAAIVFAVIKLFVKKTRYVKFGYIALLLTAVILIACFITSIIIIF